MSIGGQLSPATLKKLFGILQGKFVFGLFDSSEKEQALCGKIKEIVPEIKQLAHQLQLDAVNSHVEQVWTDVKF